MIAKMIKEFCDEAFENDEMIKYENAYSGRCMYGDRCVGIYTEENTMEVIVRLCDYLRDNGIDNAYDALEYICTDQLGMGMIIYFPNIEGEDDYDYDDYEEDE